LIKAKRTNRRIYRRQRDVSNSIGKYSEKIRVEGIEQGELEGVFEAKKESVQKMLEEGIEIKLVSRITGLEISEIKKLQRNLS